MNLEDFQLFSMPTKRFDPSHPAADGHILLPNVNPLIEMSDMRETLRSYEADLSVIEA